MAVDMHCIIKGLNIFENKTVSMVVARYLETVQPFSFNKGKAVTAVRLCFMNGVDDTGYFYITGKCICNDFLCIQVPDACQVDKTVICPNIGNIVRQTNPGCFGLKCSSRML